MFNLESEANEFACRLTKLLNSTVCEDAKLECTFDGKNQALLTSGIEEKSIKPLPLVTGPRKNNIPVLGISVFYKLIQDGNEQHLSVLTSGISLVMNDDRKNPVIRLEFDRGQGIEPGEPQTRRHRRQAAHVQIHGHSANLAAIWALNGRLKKIDLENLHIPVGGKRFRPSVEDFIEFLYTEELIARLHEGGKRALNDSRDKWLEIQLRAAVRSKPQIAIEQLKSMNYEINLPGVNH